MPLLRLIFRSGGLLASSALLGLLLAACASSETADGSDAEPASEVGGGAETGDLLVVATTSILGDVAEQLLADDGAVEVLMPPGTDPHGFEPSAADAGMLREADLVVANGLQLEESLLSALEAAEQEGVRVLEVAPELDPIPFAFDGPDDHGHEDERTDDGDEHTDDGDEHADDGHAADGEGGAEDPHVWHDPVRMVDGVELIAAELADAAETVEPATWERRAEAYVDELLTVHEEIDGMLEDVAPADRVLITNHDSFGYLAARYDFDIVGTVVPGASTQAETDAQAFGQLIETVEEVGVEVIFSENTGSDRLAEQLASEVLDRSDLDIEVVQLYSDALGPPGSDADSYLGMLRHNARLIAEALG